LGINLTALSTTSTPNEIDRESQARSSFKRSPGEQPHGCVAAVRSIPNPETTV
jgi:hypothetical protein